MTAQEVPGEVFALLRERPERAAREHGPDEERRDRERRMRIGLERGGEDNVTVIISRLRPRPPAASEGT